MSGPRTLPRLGVLALEGGEIVGRRHDGTECGRFYVGPDGVEFEGELSIVQYRDPAKLRFKVVRKDGERCYIGGFSANVARASDGRGDEVGYDMFAIAEDAAPHSLRGQRVTYLRRVSQEEPTPVLVLTSAYSGEYHSGLRRLYVALKAPLWHLWKFAVGEGEDDDQPETPPDLPVDEWLTPENQAKHEAEIARIRAELAPLELDEDRVAAYMAGRNKNLAEVHDDEWLRSGVSGDPCGGVNRIPL